MSSTVPQCQVLPARNIHSFSIIRIPRFQHDKDRTKFIKLMGFHMIHRNRHSHLSQEHGGLQLSLPFQLADRKFQVIRSGYFSSQHSKLSVRQRNLLHPIINGIQCIVKLRQAFTDLMFDTFQLPPSYKYFLLLLL